jgi:hypothetical protein
MCWWDKMVRNIRSFKDIMWQREISSWVMTISLLIAIISIFLIKYDLIYINLALVFSLLFIVSFIDMRYWDTKRFMLFE